MNEQTVYSEMLEIPVNTCNITFKEGKKRRKRKSQPVPQEEVKEMVLEKLNGDLEAEMPAEEPPADRAEETVVIKSKPKKNYFSVIGIQIGIICVLLGVIIFSNLYMEQSGIATFLSSVFSGGQTTKSDTREYSAFNAAAPIDGDITVSDGVMTFSAKGSLYAPCDGKITAIERGEDGKYTVEIEHSTKFKTVIKGVDYAYCELGGAVYGNIPIGYSLGENVELCFYGGGELITGYTLDGDTVIWAV